MVLSELRRKRLAWVAAAVVGICLPAALDLHFTEPPLTLKEIRVDKDFDEDISKGIQIQNPEDIHRSLAVPPGAPIFTLHKLVDTTQALCLDGSPGAFYYRPSASGATDKWQIFFEGGGWCYDEDDCSGRARTTLGGSHRYHKTIDNPGMMGGITSNDCEVNPTFCDYNTVYMKYCDGNSFSGAREGKVHVVPDDDYNDADDPYGGRRKTPIYFRGHYILMESLEYMKNNLGMSAATTLHVTGCSAGGLAAYLNAQTIGDWAYGNGDWATTTGPNLPSLSKYAVSPVSGFFLEHDTVAGPDHPVYSEQMAYVFEMQNAQAGVNQACIESKDPEDEYQCNFAHAALAHTTYPVFAIDANFDSWQSSNIFISPLYDEETHGFDRCALGIKASWRGIHCARYQMRAIAEYQEDFEEQLTHHESGDLLSQNPNNGAFIFQCFTHCAGSRDNYYSGFAVNNVTMSSAVDTWWNALDVEVQVQEDAHVYIDEPFPLDGAYSNPTCPVVLGGRTGTGSDFVRPPQDEYLKVGSKHSLKGKEKHAQRRADKVQRMQQAKNRAGARQQRMNGRKNGGGNNRPNKKPKRRNKK